MAKGNAKYIVEYILDAFCSKSLIYKCTNIKGNLGSLVRNKAYQTYVDWDIFHRHGSKTLEISNEKTTSSVSKKQPSK